MIQEAAIEKAVNELFDGIEFTKEPAGLYDPLRYMIKIGGKRIRPRLCLTAYSLYHDILREDILEPAAALEVFHTFTLIHDDIMDRSPLRRGMPTVWKQWNEDTAILSGDVMLIDAYKRIAKAPAGLASEVLTLFSRTAAEVCEGQQYDMEFESVREVPMRDYEKMIGLKTAVLLACSAQMGAMLGGAPKRDCEALYRYGYLLGMAFQVADDYLDAFGDEKVFGKPIGGDIINEKKSWLTVRALEKTTDKEKFFSLFETKPCDKAAEQAKIESVREAYLKLGVDLDAKAEVRRFSSLALEAISELGYDDAQTAVLSNFAEKLIGRAK